MANTVPVLMSATVQDELGTSASTRFYSMVDPSTTLTLLEGEFAAWLVALDGITDGKIIKGSMQIQPPISGVKTSPVAGGRVEQTGVFNFGDTSSGRRNGFDIPALADAVISGGKIDLTNAAVTAFLTILEAAFTSGTGGWANAFRIPLKTGATALIDAVLSFREHRKSLARSSFEL